LISTLHSLENDFMPRLFAVSADTLHSLYPRSSPIPTLGGRTAILMAAALIAACGVGSSDGNDLRRLTTYLGRDEVAVWRPVGSRGDQR
jgi:hypothetical protein